ncbi:ubiquitin carboxyl-terminal hydrolase [Hamiltosporidium magnivora]|uniref:ubiquitinyl hydrolase 1 n=1 Tax=Hamiltosporidium magnivora TaxID=148818 RepID=A0A4Q9LJ07_9MICR|nr:ubiquitin carboxyl-terminal hydrolase [Hamiltosporidium magnivora]
MRLQVLLIAIELILTAKKSSKKATWNQNIYPKLKNQKNICYFNSLIQCLYNIESFFDFIINHDKNPSKPVTSNIRAIIGRMSKEKNSIESVSYLENAIFEYKDHGFVLSKQNDASEIFIYIINKMIEEAITSKINEHKSIEAKENKKLRELFYLSFFYKFKCQKCSYASRTNNEITNAINVAIAKSVQEALNKHFKSSEPVEKDCESCKGKNITTEKRCEIIDSPQILTIIFKTFNNDAKKLQNEIFIEENIVFHRSQYKLKGFIKHIGAKTSSGHYIAYVLKRNTLVYFNDDSKRDLTQKEKEDALNKGKPYVLFYERIT